MTTIDGADVHFAHVRSPEADATPLVITHGWPGSIVEFAEVVGPLSDPRAYGGDPADAFHLVIPSIPGFGFSGPTRETGWEFQRVAGAFGELMRRLGYRRYGAQGGDWGALISRELGRTQADQIIGVHLNLIPGAGASAEPSEDELSALSPAERERTLASWERTRDWTSEKQGYADLQASRPQTLAYALTDSPVGQLAWIAEKFTEWTDSRDLRAPSTATIAHQRDALLADQDGGLLCPHLLRAGARRLLGQAAGAVERTDRAGRLSPGEGSGWRGSPGSSAPKAASTGASTTPPSSNASCRSNASPRSAPSRSPGPSDRTGRTGRSSACSPPCRRSTGESASCATAGDLRPGRGAHRPSRCAGRALPTRSRRSAR
jgi:pimeloyl-ACP methyl ester carboxylesterase